MSCAASSANLLGAEVNGICVSRETSLANSSREALWGIEARSDSRSALREAQDPRHDPFDPVDAVGKLRSIAGEFLAQGQRRRVLQVGAADLDDRVPALRLVGQSFMHLPERGEQPLVNRSSRGDMHGRREAVVRRLALVHVVVRVDRLLAAAIATKDLVGAAGDHLIGVHVRLRARPGLPDDQRELAVEIAAGDFGGGLLDRLGKLRVEAADARVHPRRGLLDEAQRMDDLQRHLLARAEREIARSSARSARPNRRLPGTSIGPKLSVSVRVLVLGMVSVRHAEPGSASVSMWAHCSKMGPETSSG